MIVKVDINLTDEQETLLLDVSLNEGYEQLDIDDNKDDLLHELVNLGVIETILGEQFYVTNLGRQYLNLKGY